MPRAPLLAIVVALALASPVQAASLKLLVSNSSTVDQADAPVASGIPFPQGALESPDAVRLLDPKGAERPLQAKALACWPDGSVKWLLLDFQATARRGGDAIYTLEYGAGVLRKPFEQPRVAVRADDAQVAVSTGAATFRLSRKGFRLFDEVLLKDEVRSLVASPSDSDGLVLDATGEPRRRFFSSLGPARVEVEADGPVRATVRVAGKLQADDGSTLCDYLARLHFVAGEPAARLQLTVVNREKLPLPAGDLSVRLPLSLRGMLFWSFAGESGGAGHQGVLNGAGDRAALVQSGTPSRYAVLHNGRETADGAQAAGGVGLWDRTRGAAVVLRGFAPNRPKALRVLGSGHIEVGLFPSEAAPREEFPAGSARTADLLLWFHGAEPPLLSDLAAAFDGPLAACAMHPDELDCTGRWYAASGVVVGGLAPRGTSDHDLRFKEDFAQLLAGREANGAFGDLRLDPTFALAREHLRRGEASLLGVAHAAARHLADAGTFHGIEGDSPAWTGACYGAGTLAPEASWYAGAWLVGLVTGDRALLDAALENARFAIRHADDPGLSPLAMSLALINLCWAADLAPAMAPDDLPALQAALDTYLSRLLDAQRLGGHGLYGDSGVAAGISLEALEACQRRRPDPRIPPSLLRAAQALTRPAGFWSGHETNGAADGLIEDWSRRPEAAVHGIACSLALPHLAAIGEAAGDTAFIKKARRLERVATLFRCESPTDFALRYRNGDLFAAAWQRHVAAHPPAANEAIALQCRLENAADVAFPDIGVGGSVLFRPFVALPDGTRAVGLAASGLRPPASGLWFPLLDSGNVAERQGTIEFRILHRKPPAGRATPWVASGDLKTEGFALSGTPDGLELLSRSPGRQPVRILARDAKVQAGKWHHVAIAWARTSGIDLFFDGRNVGHSSSPKLGLARRLEFPCDAGEPPSDYLIDGLRIWREKLDTFPALADTVPPAAVTDLMLAPAEEGKMLLSWTAPDAGGEARQARCYDIRISTRRLLTPLPPREGTGEGGTVGTPSPSPLPAINWAEADRIVPAPKPQPAGRLEKLLIGPLPAGLRFYIALRAEDETNASPLSNVVATDVNHPPVADAGPPVRQVITGTTVVFDARDSSDPDDDDLTREWSNGLKGPTPSLRYGKPGTYGVTLTVSDGRETAAAATRVVVGDTVRINFQPRRSPRTPAGFVPDCGDAYVASRGYGWRVISDGAAAFARTQPGGLALEVATGLSFPASAEWVIDLPSGTYKLTAAFGDPLRWTGQNHVSSVGHAGRVPAMRHVGRVSLHVEGKEAAAIDFAAQPSPFVLRDYRAIVADGQLNLRLGTPPEPGKPAAPGGDINYLILQRLE